MCKKFQKIGQSVMILRRESLCSSYKKTLSLSKVIKEEGDRHGSDVLNCEPTRQK